MCHNLVRYLGHFLSGFLPPGGPDLPGGHNTQGLGFKFYSLSLNPGTDEGRQPLSELRPSVRSLLITEFHGICTREAPGSNTTVFPIL